MLEKSMDGKYMVMVLCLTYNHELYLEDALKGFVMQKTNFPFIAVVIDDCSTDGTANILHQYEETYPEIIKAVYLPENYYSQGKSKYPFYKEYQDNSKYIALCEGDDYWIDPLKLQKQVDLLEQHEEYSMCCTAFSQTINGKESEKTKIVFDLDDIDIRQILEGQWIGTLTVMYRKGLVHDYKPPFSNLPMGDLPLWCHLAQKGTVKYIKDITANYRRLDKSACHFPELSKQFAFDLEAMRVREYYAKKIGYIDAFQATLSKKSKYMLDVCFCKGYMDIPLDKLWHFVSSYGKPSGYDKLKYWGLKSKSSYALSRLIYYVLKRQWGNKRH